MKKIFTSMILLALAVLANAADFKAFDKSAANILYIEGTLQSNNKGVLNVYMKSDITIGAVDFQFFLPEGFTLINTETEKATSPHGTYDIYPGQSDGSIKNAIYGMTWTASETPKLLATIPVNVTAGVGTYKINAIQYQMVVKADATAASLVNNVYTEVNVQRQIPFTPQGSDYAFTVAPFATATAESELKVMMTNKYDVASFKLTVDYPNGISAKGGRGASPTVINSGLYSSTDASVKALSIAKGETVGNSTTYTVSNSDLDTYLASTTAHHAFSLPIIIDASAAGPLPVKISVSDIVAYDTKNDKDLTNPINVDGGDYVFTVFVGNSTTDANPILYGLYTKEVVSALSGNANVKAMLKDVATIDATSAVVKDFATAAAIGNMCATKLLYSKLAESTYTNMYRTTTGWSSICVPFKVTSNSSIQYYEVSNTVSDGIVLKEVASVAANTPAFCKATKAVTLTQPGYIIPGTPAEGASAAGLATKGTYSKISLADGAGYYLSGGKLYNDGATVQAFRAYLEGSLANAKELRIYLEETTGIRDITDEFSKEEIFNLQGIKMNKTQKGVNIINGKKVLVK